MKQNWIRLPCSTSRGNATVSFSYRQVNLQVVGGEGQGMEAVAQVEAAIGERGGEDCDVAPFNRADALCVSAVRQLGIAHDLRTLVAPVGGLGRIDRNEPGSGKPRNQPRRSELIAALPPLIGYGAARSKGQRAWHSQAPGEPAPGGQGSESCGTTKTAL